MNQRASQPDVKLDLRTAMPDTAKWVEDKRKEYGPEFVNRCIRGALKGEPGLFYAIEKGHVLGTPFPATDWRNHYQGLAVVNGSTFAAFIAEPSEPAGPAEPTPQPH